jgi:hypothetical protein
MANEIRNRQDKTSELDTRARIETLELEIRGRIETVAKNTVPEIMTDGTSLKIENEGGKVYMSLLFAPLPNRNIANMETIF